MPAGRPAKRVAPAVRPPSARRAAPTRLSRICLRPLFDAAVSPPLLLVARMTCLRTLPRRLRWSPSWQGKYWSSCARIATPPFPRPLCLPRVACPRNACRRTPWPCCDRCAQLPRGLQHLPGSSQRATRPPGFTRVQTQSHRNFYLGASDVASAQCSSDRGHTACL